MWARWSFARKRCARKREDRMDRRLDWVGGASGRSRWALLAIGLGIASACTSDVPMESTARSRGALSATAARVLGLDAPSDWTASGATLGGGGSHIQGTGSLAVSNVTSATITSRALSTLGA